MTIRMTRRESRWRVAPLALRFWRGQRTAWLSAEADASLKAARGATSPSCGRSCAPEAAIGCSQHPADVARRVTWRPTICLALGRTSQSRARAALVGRVGGRGASSAPIAANGFPVQANNISTKIASLAYYQSGARSRYPTPVSVRMYCGRSGSASIFCRSCRT
jgi:hypothetical protein